VQFVDLALQRVEEQLHQPADFLFRPCPVLAGEREQGQRLDAAVEADVDAEVDRAGTGTMADQPRTAATFGPAAVAVHDDGKVAWDTWLWRGRLLCSRS
jgi:hypothetical protein